MAGTVEAPGHARDPLRLGGGFAVPGANPSAHDGTVAIVTDATNSAAAEQNKNATVAIRIDFSRPAESATVVPKNLVLPPGSRAAVHERAITF